jgi:hypothetical protein
MGGGFVCTCGEANALGRGPVATLCSGYDTQHHPASAILSPEAAAHPLANSFSVREFH